jgi:hypothetical protein
MGLSLLQLRMVLYISDHICIGDEMLRHYDIPDPFQTFVAKKYANAKGYGYDFFTGEWSYKCSTCKDDLYAPSRKIMTKIRLFHTRNECLGGY